jgi:hypothetical protein
VLAIAVDLWDEERFFEAHEVLEGVWHQAPDPDRLFWQGIIQVAVACCHHQRGNPTGSASLFRQAADIWMNDLPEIVIAEERHVWTYNTTCWTGWPNAENPYANPVTNWLGTSWRATCHCDS